MHFVLHFIISLMLSTLFFLATGSLEGSIACFVAGVIIDLDHFIDCIFLHRRIDLERIFDIRNHTLYADKVVVTFHSLELMVLPVVLGVSHLTAGIAIGLFTHIISDFFYYRKTRQKSLWSMFFVYRMSKGFSVAELCGH